MRLICYCMLLITGSVLAPGAIASEITFPHISVVGYGEMSVTPDMAKFSVTATETTLDAKRAKESVDKSVSDFIAALSAKGIKREDIESSSLYLMPQYHYPGEGRAELVGYRATRNVVVTVRNLTHLDSYLNSALSEGINQVDSLHFDVSNRAAYQNKVRKLAINDAQHKAAELAKGFQHQLGAVWQIDYNASAVKPVAMRKVALDSQSTARSYQATQIILRDRVSVIYKLH